MAMRVTQRSGRTGSAKHNDRSFLQGRNVEEVAPHIDADRMRQNRIVGGKEGQTLEDHELEYYRRTYSQALDARNEAYKAQRHPERCKTIEDIYHGQKTRPEELILQIGDMKDGVDVGTFEACMKDYLKELTAWNQEHGNHMQILDIAVHTDEASLHAHIRRVWEYENEKGYIDLGQNKALKAAGVELPDPSKPEGRYNNRKITFDQEMRSRWQEICRSHGLDIEDEPRPARKHLQKADYIAEQKQAEINEKQQQLESISQDLKEAKAIIDKALKAEKQADALKSRVDSLETKERILNAAQVAKVSKNAKTGLFNDKEVKIPKQEYEALIRTAMAAEAARREAAKLSYEQREKERQLARERAKIREEDFREKANRLKAENTIEKLKALPEGQALLAKLAKMEKEKIKTQAWDRDR